MFSDVVRGYERNAVSRAGHIAIEWMSKDWFGGNVKGKGKGKGKGSPRIGLGEI